MATTSQFAFQKSSYSTSQNCVEIASMADGAAVRDSKLPAAGHLAFPASEWRAFLDSVRQSEL